MIVFFIVLFSFLLSKFFEFIEIPKIMAPLFVGVAFKYFYSTPVLAHLEVFKILGDLGIIMLLFYTGLELDIKSLKKLGRETTLVAIFGIILSFGLGFILTYYVLEYSFIICFVISSALSITAQGVMAILLDETKMLKSRVGEIILGAGIIDDLIGILLLFIVSLMVSSKNFSLAMLRPLFIGMIFVFMFFYFFNTIKKFLGDLFLKEEKGNFYDVFTLSLIVVFLIAGCLSFIGFDFSIGAILAGIILNVALKSKGKEGIKEEHLIDKFVKAISFGFLNYFFFFWIGFNIDLGLVLQNPMIGILLALVGFMGKFLAGMFAVYFSKDTLKNGLLIGLGMSTKGAVELVLAEIANQTGLLSAEIFSSIVFMGIVLTIIPPIIFNLLVKLENKKS